MNKRLKQVLLGSLMIFILGVIYYFYHYSENSHTKGTSNLKPVSIDVKTNKPEVESGSQLNSFNVTNEDSEFVNAFESIKSAEAGLDLINSLLSQGRDGLAIDLLQTLHERCGHIGGWEAPYEKTTWAYDKIIAYCSSYNSDLYNAWLDKPVSMELFKPDFSTLVFDEEITSIDDVSSEFLDRLSQIPSRRSVLDISNTIRSFSQGFGTPLELGQTESINLLDVEIIQNTAIELYSCQKFGGCGPDDFLTLGMCALSNQCQPGWSMMDYYQNTLSPLNFDQVMNIVNEIYRHESPKP